MARLKKRGDFWHARVRWTTNGKEKEIQINLRTSNKSEAYERCSEVNKYESDIKSGMKFLYPWEHSVSKTKVKRFIIEDVKKEWLEYRKKRVAESTYQINKDGINYFCDFFGLSEPLKSIKTKFSGNLAWTTNGSCGSA